ncbi:MAG: prepilin-type N-terminal cleavage/methylation domain-containing protein [Myxococcales bacterium]|nr:MAG: prepilin-type N-terminal cleavage/methylation domain-containing protein [Myxococcales bacterium]
MLSKCKNKDGFTLIELMIVVAILGVLAGLAIPAFIGYVRQSKTSEATSNLDMLYKGATSYYSQERTESGITATTNGGCTVASAALLPSNPGTDKQFVDFQAAGEEWAAVNFSVSDAIYFGYRIISAGGGCANTADNTNIYTFQAQGDLDGDDVNSIFELAVGSDARNEALSCARFLHSKPRGITFAHLRLDSHPKTMMVFALAGLNGPCPGSSVGRAED